MQLDSASPSGARRILNAEASREEARVIFASALGTVFEWYDFFIYATLAPFFATLFFPPENPTAALLAAFATYAAGFIIRPFGAIVFGRIGDVVGRKYTFLLTVVVMGGATIATGCLPTFAQLGWVAPVILVLLRLLQGLALGGEYGGAATYVAEYAPQHSRGYATAWVQTTATFGLLLSLSIILACREGLSVDQFRAFGWRLPFVVSVLLLGWTLIIRMRLKESPVFQRMLSEGRASRRPLVDTFLRAPNNLRVFAALFGACAGQGVVWYTGQFYALFFMTTSLHLPERTAYLLLGGALLAAMPLFLVFGRLSDRFGRKRIILAGCLLSALLYLPLFHMLAQAVNPGLMAWQKATPVSVAADECRFHVFVGPWSEFSACDIARGVLASQGVGFETGPAEPGQAVVVTIGQERVLGAAAQPILAALARSGYQAQPDPAQIDAPKAFLALFLMVVLVTMVYGPMAAFLVELFPTRIRYTSISFPYHIGNGWFGGMLPLLSTALVAWSGNLFAGLYYPIAVAGLTVVVGALCVHDRRGVDLNLE